MKNRKFFYYLLIATIPIINYSCKKDDNSDTECFGTGGNANQVKSYGGLNPEICFTYNNQNKLQSWGSTEFIYDNNGKITEWLQVTQGITEVVRTYNYDSQGRLANYSDYYIDVTLTYDGNLITITGDIPNGYPLAQSLELNENGLVSKLITSDGDMYTYTYDENDNMILKQFQSQDGTYTFESDYLYDNNPNPFYGELTSIYLERFIDSEGRIVGITGYSYPYLKNNYLGSDDFTEAEYEYNSNNLPTHIKQNHPTEGCCYEYYLTY